MDREIYWEQLRLREICCIPRQAEKKSGEERDMFPPSPVRCKVYSALKGCGTTECVSHPNSPDLRLLASRPST
jgi:hypothetical protein